MTAFQANISLWLNCNLKCPYCFGNPEAPPRSWDPLIAERLDLLVDFLARTGSWTVTMSGGEVTIYPGFADLCRRLHEAGHRVEFFTNGIKPLAEVFPGESIDVVDRVAFSYHVGLEKAASLDAIFDENLAFLRRRGIAVDVNYVLYPGRRDPPQRVKERFLGQGVDFRFLTFQGEFEQKQYPFAYTQEEKRDFARFGDLRAAFLMEHGYYLPTFKKCRAGHRTFYISLRTGGVYMCEQLQQRILADFTTPDGAAAFLAAVAPEPVTCPAKRCTCRLTVDQENFLATHDQWDMSLYPRWESLSLPTAKAVSYWSRRERAFAEELAGRLAGNHVYLWGGGVHTLMLLRLLREQDFPLDRLEGIIDSNPLKHGQEILGIPIVSRRHFDDHGAAACSDILISSRAFEEEIAGIIGQSYGDRFNVVLLYDGGLQNSYEALDGHAEF